MRKAAAVIGLTLLAGLGQVSCGGDDCQKCSGVAQACPKITVQCSWGTMQVQQCTSLSGHDQGCCATQASQIPCTMNAPDDEVAIAGDVVTLGRLDSYQCMHVRIDAAANGWVTPQMGDAAKKAAIRARLDGIFSK